MITVIEKNKAFFEDEVLSSLKYLSENFNIAFNDELKINYNWKVFANYFLCVDAIKEQNQKNAENFLKSALDHLSVHNPNTLVPSRPEILVITNANISEYISKTLKDIYDKPDNDINDDGVYAFGPFTGNSEEEIVKIHQSLDLMKSVSPYYYDFVNSLIKHIVLVGQTERGGIKSGSTLKALGCIIISPNTKEEISSINQYIEDLVHEASHSKLFLEQTKDQLVNNPIENLYTAPFRKDKRPMSGIYHANYVLGNIVSYFRQAVKADPNSNEKFLERALTRYNETYNIIEQYGDLTERGYAIFKEMKERVDQCLN
ncbi:HEXXH motif domain-containing protein [Photorhabdus temperata]|uniref:HEXXH motif protein n=1 Tax=Photorhabdus temperata subsp. temperata Meg1 TaxID=1393735 RepID=A0A081S1E0_PHOTE|nr:HEXXH motif domain-containing protein [Photorhabdus temperata]KER04743.1 HEXXH motif protein [Photorhabdus temperata subsp. temperata Meg1]MCT8345796.1 HEXXH motif domain-containing protein [Photorhabdus temperata]